MTLSACLLAPLVSVWSSRDSPSLAHKGIWLGKEGHQGNYVFVCPVPDRIHRKIRELRTQKGAGHDGCETQTVFGGVQAQGRAGEPSARYHPGGSLPEIWHLQFHAASLAASVSGPGGHHLSGSTRSQTQSPGAGVCTR